MMLLLGTTAIASFNLGRNCVTMDINTDAIEIATETVDELYTPELNPLAQALY